MSIWVVISNKTERQVPRGPHVRADSPHRPHRDQHHVGAGQGPSPCLQLLRHFLPVGQPEQGPRPQGSHQSRNDKNGNFHSFFIFPTLMASLSTIAQSYIVHYDMAEAIKNASESKVVMCEATTFLQYTIRLREISCEVWGLLTCPGHNSPTSWDYPTWQSWTRNSSRLEYLMLCPRTQSTLPSNWRTEDGGRRPLTEFCSDSAPRSSSWRSPVW